MNQADSTDTNTQEIMFSYLTQLLVGKSPLNGMEVNLCLLLKSVDSRVLCWYAKHFIKNIWIVCRDPVAYKLAEFYCSSFIHLRFKRVLHYSLCLGNQFSNPTKMCNNHTAPLI